MGKAQVFLRAQLLEERELLRSQLAQLPVQREKGLGYSNHMADDATVAFEQATELALRQNLERTLRQVEHAIRRLDRGTYGTCEECGREIDAERLAALPYATLCLDCKGSRTRVR
jgi:DnaK suppressor protein